MKKSNAVRWAAFLMMLLANADAAKVEMIVGRSLDGLQAKCGRCGQTGPTIPEVPVVFRVRPTGGVAVFPRPGDAGLGAAVRNVRSNLAVPVRDEFALDSARPAVGASFTR
jgi:hypothetical protein